MDQRAGRQKGGVKFKNKIKFKKKEKKKGGNHCHGTE